MMKKIINYISILFIFVMVSCTVCETEPDILELLCHSEWVLTEAIDVESGESVIDSAGKQFLKFKYASEWSYHDISYTNVGVNSLVLSPMNDNGSVISTGVCSLAGISIVFFPDYEEYSTVTYDIPYDSEGVYNTLHIQFTNNVDQKEYRFTYTY